MKRAVALSLALAGVAISIGLSAWAYPHLPPQLATHWDLAGRPNGYGSRWVAVATLPAVLFFVTALMVVLPVISPRGFQIQRFAGTFYESCLAIVGALLVVQFAVLRAQMGGTAPSNAWVFGSIGGLLFVLGNLMGKFQRNFFIDVRTPWTLANDEVWLRTNGLGARLMVGGGLLLFACGFFPRLAGPALIAIVTVVAGVPIVYSYLLYRQIEGFGPDGRSRTRAD